MGSAALAAAVSYPGKVTQISYTGQKVLYVNLSGVLCQRCFFDFCPKGTERVNVSFFIL